MYYDKLVATNRLTMAYVCRSRAQVSIEGQRVERISLPID